MALTAVEEIRVEAIGSFRRDDGEAQVVSVPAAILISLHSTKGGRQLNLFVLIGGRRLLEASCL